MPLPGFLTRQQIVAAMVQQYQADCVAYGITPWSTDDLSQLGAIFDAAAFGAFAIQSEVGYVAGVVDVDSATGADLDQLVAPYGIFRAGGNAATGLVSLSLASAASVPVTIPFGTVFSRSPDQLQYVLVSDGNEGPSGYVFPANTAEIMATVSCTSAGSIGNTLPNTVATIVSGLGQSGAPPFQSVTNPAAFTNGSDAESDASVRSRFKIQIAGGLTGTPLASYTAAAATGLLVSVGDCLTQTGATLLGWESIFVAPLGGASTPAQLAVAYAAVDAIRSGGMQFAVYAPAQLSVQITAFIRPDGTVPWATLQPAATAALTAYVNSVGMTPIQKPGNIQSNFVKISGAYNALTGRDALGNQLVPGIAAVDDLLLNGGYASISVPYGTIAIVSGVSVTQE